MHPIGSEKIMKTEVKLFVLITLLVLCAQISNL